MKIMLLVLITAFSLFLTACGSDKRVVIDKHAQIPSWYLNPPKSEGSVMYALGEGKSKREAIDNALSLMASTLSVSISSTFDAKTIVKEGRVNSSEATYVNQTLSEVKKIRIVNYEILNAAKLGFKRMAVLVRADKRKVFLGLKDDLDQRFLILQNEQNSLQQEDALKKLFFYEKSLQKLADVPDILAVMKVLNQNFDQKLYLQKLHEYKNSYNTLHSKITFSLIAVPNAVMLKKPIAKGLSVEGFTLADKKDSFHYKIFINANIAKANSYGFSIARAEITLITKDNHDNVVATNLLHITGQSSQGYAIALQDLSKKFDTLVKDKGVKKVLSLNI
ncbi:LPP20 family lipoprotein [Sulfurimonas sp.]|uniref:LPP20 family lipoprotein n=1 Tax=Sulfurimonas sp. TaxID=2022749 RepID=UPI00262F4CAB|nr:LPP20 family lipoprotein [Sulfurimonas sp.]